VCQPIRAPSLAAWTAGLICISSIEVERNGSSPAFCELANTQSDSAANCDAAFHSNNKLASAGSRGNPDCEYLVFYGKNYLLRASVDNVLKNWLMRPPRDGT